MDTFLNSSKLNTIAEKDRITISITDNTNPKVYSVLSLVTKPQDELLKIDMDEINIEVNLDSKESIAKLEKLGGSIQLKK